MEILKLSTQELISFKQLRETYRNVAFPADITNADLSQYDAAVVVTDPMPESYDPAAQVLELSEPTLINGQWRRTWAIEARKINSITMAQCRLELYARGLLDDVETALSTMGKEAQIEWETRTKVLRSSALVSQMGLLFQMTDEDLDDFFMEASQR